MTLIYKPLKFPQAHLPHNTIIEWWYFNGHLQDSQGNKYSYMNCLFKADNKKVNIPFLRKLPFKTIYFSHCILTDLNKKNFYSEISPVSIVSKDSFNRELLFVNYINPSLTGYINNVLEQTSNSNFHIKTTFFDLNLTSTKKPVLVGGKGFVKLNKKLSYYYSLSNLKTKGTIFLPHLKKFVSVKGISWMDHQWANESYSKDKWVWFSIQLNNNIELICFEYSDKINKTYLATIVYPNGTQKSFSEITITHTQNFWTSQKTGAKYPLSWQVVVPQENLFLNISAIKPEQEVIFGEINYWEGPMTVSGTYKNHKIQGKAFMELVGFIPQKNKIQIYKTEIKEQIKKILFPQIKKFFYQKFPLIKNLSKQFLS